jgi:hypothetical protein
MQKQAVSGVRPSSASFTECLLHANRVIVRAARVPAADDLASFVHQQRGGFRASSIQP